MNMSNYFVIVFGGIIQKQNTIWEMGWNHFLIVQQTE